MRQTPKRKPAIKNPFQRTYVFECPVCHKRFKRTKYDFKLNPHKGTHGHKCVGTVGILKSS